MVEHRLVLPISISNHPLNFLSSESPIEIVFQDGENFALLTPYKMKRSATKHRTLHCASKYANELLRNGFMAFLIIDRQGKVHDHFSKHV